MRWVANIFRLILIDYLTHHLVHLPIHLIHLIMLQVREVDSSSDPMFPGSDAGQELVLHTLEQIPEDERFQ